MREREREREKTPEKENVFNIGNGTTVGVLHFVAIVCAQKDEMNCLEVLLFGHKFNVMEMPSIK